MCRLVAYLGAQPASLHDVIVAPEHSLLEQSYAPRMQAHGRVNADGFGVGWYEPSLRAEPARYRRAVPIWTDRSFESFAPLVRSTAILASVRSATPPLPVEETGTAPFASGRWLFAHNGAVEGFATGAGGALKKSLSERRAAEILGASDSEVLFAMILDRLDAGAAPADAIADTIRATKEIAGGRFNVLMTDGERVVASRCGDTLFVARDHVQTGSIVLASEPFDGAPGWDEVPDLSIVEATAGGEVEVKPL